MVSSVSGPVTLKYRTGMDEAHINAVRIAKMAESVGVQMLTLHGRTRAQAFRGEAEYETIRQVKQAVGIPVIANGDIDSGAKALQVLQETGADGVMIGRAAMGNPWIFEEISAALDGRRYVPPSKKAVIDVIAEHTEAHLSFYGSERGLKTIRKHISWYFKRLDLCTDYLKRLYEENTPSGLQQALVRILEDELPDGESAMAGVLFPLEPKPHLPHHEESKDEKTGVD